MRPEEKQPEPVDAGVLEISGGRFRWPSQNSGLSAAMSGTWLHDGGAIFEHTPAIGNTKTGKSIVTSLSGKKASAPHRGCSLTIHRGMEPQQWSRVQCLQSSQLMPLRHRHRSQQHGVGQRRQQVDHTTSGKQGPQSGTIANGQRMFFRRSGHHELMCMIQKATPRRKIN